MIKIRDLCQSFGEKFNLKNYCGRWDLSEKINSNCLRSALYARNQAPLSIQDRLDAVHKAQHVGEKVVLVFKI